MGRELVQSLDSQPDYYMRKSSIGGQFYDEGEMQSRNRMSSYKGDVADLLGHSNFNAVSGFGEPAGADLDGFSEAPLEDENADDN